MSVKNHQIPPTILVESAFGMSSEPEREEQRRRGETWDNSRPEWGQHPDPARPLHLLPGSHTRTQSHRVGRVGSLRVGPGDYYLV